MSLKNEMFDRRAASAVEGRTMPMVVRTIKYERILAKGGKLGFAN